MTTWVKVYNSMPSHPKFLMVGGHGGWLFVCGLCYANEHLTNGFVPAHVLPVVVPGLRNPEAVAARLVNAGLWHKVDGGWRIHDYEEHQRSADEIRDRRERDRERKASVRNGSAGSPRGQTTDSARNPAGVHAESAGSPQNVRDLDVEGREQKAETEPATQAARKRVTRRVDQSQLPDDFPDELLTAVDAVQPILIRCWDARGGIEPGRRGIGLAVLRNPRADHEKVARKLEHWLTSGNGRRARCGDVAARLGDWIEGDGAAPHLAPVGDGMSELDRKRLASATRLAEGAA